MKNGDVKKTTRECHCKINRRKDANLEHECRWPIRKRKEARRQVLPMNWESSHAIEVFAAADPASVEDSNELSKNTNALATLLLKGFRRYQTKVLIRKSKTDQRLQKNWGDKI